MRAVQQEVGGSGLQDWGWRRKQRGRQRGSEGWPAVRSRVESDRTMRAPKAHDTLTWISRICTPGDCCCCCCCASHGSTIFGGVSVGPKKVYLQSDFSRAIVGTTLWQSAMMSRKGSISYS